MVEPIFPSESQPSVFSSAPQRRPRLRVAGATHAADRLVSTHHYLCRRGARKFLRSGLERSDLEQVAAIGLIKASRRYDASTKTPFEAYAWIMIVGELMHHVRDFERIVRVPRSLRDLERRLVRSHETLSVRLGREPSDAELAREMGVVVATIGDVRRARTCALAATLDDAETCRLHAVEPVALEDRFLVDAAFAALGELERRIIVGVYILGLTQIELGRRLGISPKRVSRAHHVALLRMQRAWSS